MKIGISTSVIQRGKTGVAQYVFALIRRLRSFAPQHQFILFVLNEDLPLFEFARDFAQLVPVAEHWRPAIRNVFWHQWVLPKLVRRHKLDVLHVPSYRRMLWRKPCATVATIHDLAPFHVAHKYDFLRMFYGRVVAKRLARRQQHVIAISRNTADDIERFFQIPPPRLTVVHNGIDHSRFRPPEDESARDSVAKRYGITGPFFLYTARLEHPGKNHLRLVEAFEGFEKETGLAWTLVFAGSDWHGADVIHKAILNSGASPRIRCLDFVPDPDLPALYQAADVFVYPSLFEGFGLPPLEAMACGCPVISSSRGSLGEVVGDAARIVDPDNVASMQSALLQVAGDSALRNLLRAKGIARAGSFRWEKTAAQTLQVYENAAKSFGRRRITDDPLTMKGTRAPTALL